MAVISLREMVLGEPSNEISLRDMVVPKRKEGEVSLRDMAVGKQIAPTTPTTISPVEEIPIKSLFELQMNTYKPLLGDAELPEMKPWITERDKQDFLETLAGYSRLTERPWEVHRGIGDFVASFPGFLTGLATAGQKVAKGLIDQLVLGHTLNIEDLYNMAVEGMEEGARFFEPSKELLLGRSAKESQLVGQTVMAPVLGLSAVGNAIAEYPFFKDSPNIRGAARFAADVAGFLTLGMIHRGSRAELSRKTGNILKKADEIRARDQVAEGIPDEAIKRAQKKVLEVQKQQVEMEAAELAGDLEANINLVDILKENLKKKGEEVKEVKQAPMRGEEPPVGMEVIEKVAEETGATYEAYAGEDFAPSGYQFTLTEKVDPIFKGRETTIPVKDLKDLPGEIAKKIEEFQSAELHKLRQEQGLYPAEVVGRETLKEIPELPRPESVQKQLDFLDKRISRVEKNLGPDHQKVITLKELRDKVSANELRIKNLDQLTKRPDLHVIRTEKVEPAETKIDWFGEGVKEVDRQTGTDVPEIRNDRSPFYQTKEEADAFRKIYSDRAKAVSEDVEVFTQKLINDANNWSHGDESVDIGKVRGVLSKLASEADDFRMDFLNGVDHAAWKETVSDAAEWARGLRLKNEQRPGETLQMFIGWSAEMPRAIRKMYKAARAKTLEGKSMLDIWRKTGWFRNPFDRRWRFEIDDSKVSPTPEFYNLEASKIFGTAHTRRLDEVFDHPELFKMYPELRSVKVKRQPAFMDFFGGTKGWFDDKTNTISITPYCKDIKETLLHEIQHWVQEKEGFAKGGNVKEALGQADYATLREYGDIAINNLREQRESVVNIIKDLNKKRELLESIPSGYIRDIDRLVNKYRNIDRVASAEYRKNKDFYSTDKWRSISDRQFEITSRMRNMIPGDNLYRATDVIFATRDTGIRGSIYRIVHGIRKEESKVLNIDKRIRDIETAPDASVLRHFIDDVSRVNYEAYRNLAGEIEARETEARSEISAVGRREVPPRSFFGMSPEEMRRVIVHFGKGTGVKLYSGVPLDAMGRAIIEGAKEFKRYMDYARGVKRFKPLEAAKILNQEFKRNFVDRSGNIRLDLLNKLGDVGYKIVQKMYLTKGASSLASNMLEQMRKEVYSGLSRKEKSVLDNYIMAERSVDIGKYKTIKEVNWPEVKTAEGIGKLDPVRSVQYIELFESMEKIPTDRAKIIRERARAYFEWMKKPLKDMLDAGLITEEEYNALASHKYRKRKLVDIFDKELDIKVGKRRPRTIYDSGIEALAKGRETDIFEASSEIMALEVFNRSYGRVLNNEANMSLLELARSDPKNPFARVRTKDQNIPSGWQRIFAYEKGERKSIYISPDMAKEWIYSDPEIKYRTGQFLRYMSGSPVLRTFATGINWGFALANLPRDVMHTYFAARMFDGKEWKGVYSPHLPIFLPQIGMDLARTFPDAVTRGPRYQQYIKEGGGMEFLVHQGRIFARGRRLEGPFDKIQNFMGYFGETTEIMTRLAIRDRVIRRTGDSIEGTFAARDYMDFGQGGGITKAADNALPYLNAAVQGTRGLWRVAKENPKTFAYKVAQIGAATTILYAAMREQAPKTTEALQGDIDMQNNLCIPLGDSFAFEDEKGQTRYIYFKVPLDPSQKFFKAFFEAAYDKTFGYEVDVDRVTNNLAEQSPVGVSSLPPTLSGTLGYIQNKDYWLNEDIWTKTDKPLPYPLSKEEYIPGRTPQVYIDIGEATGLSPERTRYAVEELTTSGTLWSYLMGKGYEELFADVPKEQREQHIAMVLSEMPISKRFIDVTNPYSKYASEIEKDADFVSMEQWVQRRELDRLTEGYLFQKSVERSEVFKYIRSFKDYRVRDRLQERFDFQYAIRNLGTERSWWLRLQHLDPEIRAKRYYAREQAASPEEKNQLAKERSIIGSAGGFFSDTFWDELNSLRRGNKNVE